MAIGFDDILGLGGMLLGSSSASNAASDAAAAQLQAAQIAADAAKFRPYGVTTGFGTSWFNPETQQAGYELDPALAAFRDTNMVGAAMVADQLGATGLDPTQAANKYYAETQQMMAPAREQERQQLQQDLFGSGRLGMRLASEGAGGGTGGGMYQPDVLGYNKANSLADMALAQESRSRAQAEMDQAIARSQGMFSYATGLEALGQQPLTMGAQFGGNAATAGANMGQALMSGGMGAAQANLAGGLNTSNMLSQFGLGMLQRNK